MRPITAPGFSAPGFFLGALLAAAAVALKIAVLGEWGARPAA